MYQVARLDKRGTKHSQIFQRGWGDSASNSLKNWKRSIKNQIYFRLDKEFPFDQNNDSVMAGKYYFDELESLKIKLEYRCKIDLLNLHKLKILKPKKD